MNFHLLSLHRSLIVVVLLCILLTITFTFSIGHTQPFTEIDWTDALGEGGITVITLVWIFFILISRPAGRVTNLLVVGLLFMHVSMLLDLLDEFFEYPENHAWLTAYESIPAPIGMLIMSVGLYHWHIEQLAVNEQLRRRERVYREHGLIDFITGLYSAEYMFQQIRLELEQSQVEEFSLLMLDIDHFDQFNRQYGDIRGDQFLREVSELIMYELRATDIAGRYAGDRFLILLPDTNLSHAKALGKQLQSALASRTFKTFEADQTFRCQVSASCVLATKESSVQSLLDCLNQEMESIKLEKRMSKVA